MLCSWIEADEQCLEVSESTLRNIPLCELHRAMDESRRLNTTAPAQALAYHRLEDFPGWCYVVLLPDGFIKIGYSNTDKTLQDRYRTLSREYNGSVIPLVVLPGGFVTERLMHKKFSASKVPGHGERFTYTTAMAELIAEVQAGRDIRWMLSGHCKRKEIA